MAKFPDVNRTFISGGLGNWGHVHALFGTKTQFKAAGWPVPRSSDGITYNAAGDQITGVNTGAGGMMNHRAWYVVREPGGRREWCVQVGADASSDSAQVRVKYSASARFVGGSPSPTVVPVATDQQVLLGAGTDAAPTFGQMFLGSSQPYRMHFVAINQPVSGAYYFGMFCHTPTLTTPTYGYWVQEPLAPGSYDPAGDADPALVFCGNSVNTLSCWYGYGTPQQVWVPNVDAQAPSWFNGTLGTDLVLGGDVNARPWYGKSVASAFRVKGIGAFIAAKGPARIYPATLNTATDAYVYMGAWAYPYPDNTVPLLG